MRPTNLAVFWALIFTLFSQGFGALIYTQVDGATLNGIFAVNTTLPLGSPQTVIQVADDLNVPAGFIWDITSMNFRGFFNRGANASLVTGFFLQIMDNLVAPDPNSPGNNINIPGSLIKTVTLTPTLPFTSLNATTTADFNPTFNFNLTLFPGRYWVSPFVGYNGALSNSWLVLKRNITVVTQRGEIIRVKDSTGAILTGFANQWLVGDKAPLSDGADLLYTVSGTQSVLPATTGTTGTTAAPPATTGSATGISSTTGSVTGTNSGTNSGTNTGSNLQQPGNSNVIPIAAGAAGGAVGLILVIVIIVLIVVLRRNRRARDSVQSSISMHDNNGHQSIRADFSNGSIPTFGPNSPVIPARPGSVSPGNHQDNYKAITPASSNVPNPYANNQNVVIMTSDTKFSTDNKAYVISYNELTYGNSIGSGAFGVVYKGTWRGSAVAIKQIANKVSAFEVEAFKAEAALMAALRPHSNVVQFLGVSFSPDNRFCMITEFMDGGSLYDLLHSDKKLDANMVQSFARGIAAGMLHLHSENIIHRDLAARNVLLGSNTNSVKISDFGMSRVLAENTAQSNQTKSNTGPLKWMPPESIKKREYSTYSDIWAFGVTLWEILCRQEPYPELDAVQAAIEVTNGNPPLRLQFPDFTPLILKKVAAQCMQEIPANRGSFQDICDKFAKAPTAEWYPVIGKQ